MWAQDFSNIFDLVVPYPNEKQINIDQILKDKGYNPLLLFKV
jgi:peptidyl-dipeptidase A